MQKYIIYLYIISLTMKFTADFMNQSLKSLKWRVYAKRINNYDIKYTKVFAFTSTNSGSFVIF